MRLQDEPSTCGQTTVANLLVALTRKVTPDQVKAKLKKLAVDGDPGQTAGTTEYQIMRLLEAYRIPVTQLQAHSPSLAINALRGHLMAGRPVVLAVDNDSHWLLAFGVLGATFNVWDPANIDLVYTERRLVDRWGIAGDPPRFYGLAAGKGPR